MDYEKKYREVLERLEELLNGAKKRGHIVVRVEDIENAFPELIKSEDERIRKELIKLMGHMSNTIVENYTTVPISDFVAWLEKQGEQKPADKIEPKFHENEWIIQENIGVYKVIEVCETWYEVVDNKDNHYSIGFDKEYMCRPWTIEDAKDGDVLAAQECYVIFKEIYGLNIKCYCTYHYMGFNPSFHINTLQNKTAFHPATKEQRDLLFKKMKEAGYEWDAEKKELRNK